MLLASKGSPIPLPFENRLTKSKKMERAIAMSISSLSIMEERFILELVETLRRNAEAIMISIMAFTKPNLRFTPSIIIISRNFLLMRKKHSKVNYLMFASLHVE